MARMSRYIQIKNLLDRLVAGCALVALAPAIGVLAVLVRMGSRGPSFYLQERVGLAGRRFRIIKLRTMVADAEARTGPIWARPNDSRVTRLGRVLRATHLDELPQLVNVVCGDMSLVGPRPERPQFVSRFTDDIPGYADRLSVKPGMTGLAQIHLAPEQSDRDVRRKLAYDRLYLRRMCLLTDLGIIGKTARLLLAQLRPAVN